MIGHQAASPDVTVDTSDGGQSAPMEIHKSGVGSQNSTVTRNLQASGPETVTQKFTSQTATTPIVSFRQYYHNGSIDPAMPDGPSNGAVQIQAFPSAGALASDFRSSSWLWDIANRTEHAHGGVSGLDHAVSGAYSQNNGTTEIGFQSPQPDMTGNTDWWWDLGNL